MTKQQRQQLREARVFNDYGLAKIAAAAGAVGVYVRYRIQETGRAYQPAAWQVIRPGLQTNPGGHWRDYGHKTFTVPGRDLKDAKRLEAITWASAQYGLDPQDWVPSPFGRATGWFPRGVLDTALREIGRGARLSQRDDTPIIPGEVG